MPTTTAHSGATIVNAPANTKTMKGKNALFMALVTGLAKEAKKKKETKKNKAAADEREPSQEVTSIPVPSERDAPVNDIPTISPNTSVVIATEFISEICNESTSMHKEEPLSSSQRMHVIPQPPPPAAPALNDRNICTPSPGRYHKMLSINKLGKEEPTHQIHTKAYREKAYIGPRKAITGPYQRMDEAAAVTDDVIREEKLVNKAGDTFFAELKHRAALQNVTQSLLAENKETVATVAVRQCNDEVSALGSKSFESEKTPKESSQAPSEAFELERPPKQVQVQHTKHVELPVKYLDVLPDDEKKDIVIENMKNNQGPLPFDEKVEVTVNEFEAVVSHPAVPSLLAESAHGSNELADINIEKTEEDRIVATAPVKLVQDEAGMPTQGLDNIEVTQLVQEQIGAAVPSPVAESVHGSDELADINIEKTEEDRIKEKTGASRRHTAITESDSKSQAPDTNTNVSVTSAKSVRMCKSPKSASFDDEDEEVRSFKSLPASFVSRPTVSFRRDFKDVLEKHSCKTNRLDTVVESKGSDRVTEEQLDVKNTVATKIAKGKDQATTKSDELAELPAAEMGAAVVTETDADLDDLSEIGSTAISVKEITISSSARGDRSTAIASISSKIEHQTRRLAELEMAALRKHKEAETAAIDARVALEKMLEVRSKEKFRKTDHHKRGVRRFEEVKGGKTELNTTDNVMTETKKSAACRSIYSEPEKEIRGTLKRDNKSGVAGTEFSLCSTWSEDDLKSTKLAPKLKSKGTADYDYQPVISGLQDGSVKSKGEVYTKSFTEMSEHPEVKSKPSSSSLYSEASFSQYSKNVDESTSSDDSGSYRSELVSDTLSHASSYTEDVKVSEIKKRHGRKSYRTPRNRRPSMRGRHHVQSTLSSRRSRSVSPAAIAKKSLLLPSLMSPDPPSKQGASSRQLDYHARQRSRSQPKNRLSERRSAKKHTTMSTTTRPKKPDHLLPYRRSPCDNQETEKALSAISPETRQPAFSMHTSIRQGSPNITQTSCERHNTAFSTSLAGYDHRDNASLSHSRMEIPPNIGHHQYKGHNQCTPNSVLSAPISLAGYKNKDQPYFSQFVPTSQYSQGFAMGMQTPQQLVTYTMRPYSTGQLGHAQGAQYHAQQHHAGFHNPAGRGRVNQYSMPTGGELI